MERKSGIHFGRPTDKQYRDELLARLRGESLEQLVARFNREVRIGIRGVHRQMVHIITLNEALDERTGQNTLEKDGPLIRPLRYLTIVDGQIVQHSEN